MAMQNVGFWYGRVHKEPKISVNKETGEYNYAMVYIDVVRSLRSIDDDIKFVKHDYPVVLTREKEIIDEMKTWKENSIVFIKGVLSTKPMNKTSFCPHCTDDDGKPMANISTGNLVYITPIYTNKVKDYTDKKEAIEDIVNNREISNQIYVAGTLLKDPKLITTKSGIQYCQYRIALNRKYTIRTDDPSIKTDWPIVKSYGEQARDDKLYLKYQSDIIVDGLLQARNITRKCKCKKCGELYEWKDHTMELVPYAVEYVSNYKSKEEVEAECQKTVEEAKQMLFKTAYSDDFSGDEELKPDQQ